ncbi:MAG: GNAT family N-acetyltransferase [Flavobacteriia bacterium]|nr:GNAT family N-acetyltransferase [Flavobacteriia bacterium]OIP47304.1 MAG: GNAT family N-acetyltransferase [Flavobacteriaceae bacterium CG2_30_31_66]PIV96115.1 MAG: GNAT family N-acetyltransferase [Flavobacteriaceae bacterium CG17_big_fil_post_rev_8_21_14_2_50_31_13]PIX12608.1 MAG: GNAT family N-acetyltransferase [Flavobacteriaceae bacterium CG_4_8_14_3_um_filter_31_8]PIY14332.1 MAG: GNAT family N-acetyltransferase [Flavobacteriaceae bacterium CG_4_10_14_3_um_filter_31_253]PIZ10419.1 MAG: GN
MNTLVGNLVKLRALEPEDLEFLFQIENNEIFWEVSHTQTPFSKYVLKQYLENAHLDIFESKQLRLIIEEKSTEKKVGMIDLFDFNPQHKRAGIGILIHPDFQQKGFASEALELIIKYSFSYLQLHQLYANIIAENEKSLALFTKHQFKKVGIKKDWIFFDGKMKDEILFQLIKE